MSILSQLEIDLTNDKYDIASQLESEWLSMIALFTRISLETEDGAGIDVRLIVEDGYWRLHTGDSQYETSHKGFWGSGFLVYDWDESDIDKLCLTLAEELIEGVLEERAMY